MMRTRSALACAVIVVLAIAGCGGSSKSGKPTKAAYVAKANAVCRELTQSVTAVGKNTSSLEQKLVELIGPRERANAQLQAIPKFAGDEFSSRWLGVRAQALASLKQIAKHGPFSPESRTANAAYSSQSAQAARIARNHGLVDCITFAAS
jgi:hypothetical protein